MYSPLFPLQFLLLFLTFCVVVCLLFIILPYAFIFNLCFDRPVLFLFLFFHSNNSRHLTKKNQKKPKQIILPFILHTSPFPLPPPPNSFPIYHIQLKIYKKI